MTKPGKFVLICEVARPAVPNDWVAALSTPLTPPDLKNHWVPYCRASFSVTSAMVASMRTSSGRMSTLCNMLMIPSSSRGVA